MMPRTTSLVVAVAEWSIVNAAMNSHTPIRGVEPAQPRLPVAAEHPCPGEDQDRDPERHVVPARVADAVGQHPRSDDQPDAGEHVEARGPDHLAAPPRGPGGRAARRGHGGVHERVIRHVASRPSRGCHVRSPSEARVPLFDSPGLRRAKTWLSLR
jgi:hypothetical protein